MSKRFDYYMKQLSDINFDFGSRLGDVFNQVGDDPALSDGERYVLAELISSFIR